MSLTMWIITWILFFAIGILIPIIAVSEPHPLDSKTFFTQWIPIFLLASFLLICTMIYQFLYHINFGG